MSTEHDSRADAPAPAGSRHPNESVVEVGTEDGQASAPAEKADFRGRRALSSPWSPWSPWQTLAVGLALGASTVGAMVAAYWAGHAQGWEGGYWAALAEAGLLC